MKVIGVIGCGVVGSAVANFYESKSGVEVLREDPKYKRPDQYPAIVERTNLVFVCGPTPTTNNIQDISVIEQILQKLSDMNYKGLVVLKSTVLPGTCDKLKRFNLKLVHNPEFLTAKTPDQDFVDQKLVLLSGPDAEKAADHIYRPWGFKCQTSADYRTTEMAKYLHNCFLATKVVFMNEFYMMCDQLELDFNTVRDMAVAQDRIGANHTKVPGADGFGYGGMCFPKDMAAFITWITDERLTIHGGLLRVAHDRNSELQKIELKK